MSDTALQAIQFLRTEAIAAGTDLGSRIYMSVAPQNATFPLAVMEIISRAESPTQDSGSAVDTYRVQVDVYAKASTTQSAFDIASTISNELRAAWSRQTDEYIDGIQEVNYFTDYDSELLAQRVSNDYLIRTKQVEASPVIAYQNIIHTQKTIYRTGDEGYRLVNGLFELNNPTKPTYIQQLDYEAATPYTTLLYNNAFGTTDRFTDIDGLQVYGDGIIVDHLTKRMYTQDAGTYDWNGSIDAAVASTTGGFTDWYLITRAEMESVLEMETWFDGLGLGLVTFITGEKTSTTTLTTTAAYTYNSVTNILTGGTKTTSVATPIFVRIFSETDLNT